MKNQTDIKPNLKLVRWEMRILRTIPMVLAILYFFNTLFSFFGIDSTLLSIFGGISLIPLIFLYVSSYCFHFCIYHRMFLHYILVNDILTWYDYYIGIPISISYLIALHLIIAALFLFIILYLKFRK